MDGLKSEQSRIWFYRCKWIVNNKKVVFFQFNMLRWWRLFRGFRYRRKAARWTYRKRDSQSSWSLKKLPRGWIEVSLPTSNAVGDRSTPVCKRNFRLVSWFRWAGQWRRIVDARRTFPASPERAWSGAQNRIASLPSRLLRVGWYRLQGKRCLLPATSLSTCALASGGTWPALTTLATCSWPQGKGKNKAGTRRSLHGLSSQCATTTLHNLEPKNKIFQSIH